MTTFARALCWVLSCLPIGCAAEPHPDTARLEQIELNTSRPTASVTAPDAPQKTPLEADPAARNVDPASLMFPTGDFCARLHKLSGEAMGESACADAHINDLKFNRAAMDAYYACIKQVDTWEQAAECQDHERNGKSSTFAFEYQVGDGEGLGKVSPMVSIQIFAPWVHTVVIQGELMVVVTAKDSADRNDAVALCLPRDGWEVAAAGLSKPTQVRWVLGVVAKQVSTARGNVPAMAGCFWAA